MSPEIRPIFAERKFTDVFTDVRLCLQQSKVCEHLNRVVKIAAATIISFNHHLYGSKTSSTCRTARSSLGTHSGGLFCQKGTEVPQPRCNSSNFDE